MSDSNLSFQWHRMYRLLLCLPTDSLRRAPTMLQHLNEVRNDSPSFSFYSPDKHVPRHLKLEGHRSHLSRRKGRCDMLRWCQVLADDSSCFMGEWLELWNKSISHTSCYGANRNTCWRSLLAIDLTSRMHGPSSSLVIGSALEFSYTRDFLFCL